MIKNKKGWIRIVEAFVAILLIMGIILVVIGKNEKSQEKDTPLQVYKTEIFVLRNVELNDTMRDEILSTSGTIEWDSGNFPAQTKAAIEARIPSYLECSAKLCAPGEDCSLPGNKEGDVYAETVLITANLNVYNPRNLKIFCLKK